VADIADSEMEAQQTPDAGPPPGTVLVVVPCLNEEDHIERVLAELLREAHRFHLNIVVARYSNE
jgi:hypothetical protein